MENKEQNFLNIIRGTAIFLMLWGHAVQYCTPPDVDFFENPVFKVIYSFHMPLFMLVSGYLFFFSFQKRELKPLLVHRTQGLLQPIVLASILNMLIMALPQGIMSRSVPLFDGRLLDGLFSLWFLWCVLASSLAVAITFKLAKNRWQQLLGVIFGILFISLFPDMHKQIYMYPYFVLGFLYAGCKNRIPGFLHKVKYLTIPLFPVMVCFFTTSHYIYNTPVFGVGMAFTTFLRLNSLRWSIGLVGSIAMMTILEWLLTVGRNKMGLLLNGLSILGKNSLQIYCLSVSLLSGYLPIVYRKAREYAEPAVSALESSWIVHNLVFTPTLAILYCIVLFQIVLLLKRWRLHRLIFGRG